MQNRLYLRSDLWLHSKRFDVFFFQFSALLCLLLVLVYQYIGKACVIPLYNFYLVFFGLPHNYLTWASLVPKNCRAAYNWPLIGWSAGGCLVFCVLLFSYKESWLGQGILSLITYVSLWHAYRQHHGLCKVYDSVQAERTGDRSVFADRRVMNVFFALALHAVLIWAFTHERLAFLLSADEFYELIYPRLSSWFFQAYCVVTVALGVWGLKRCLWDRLRAGKFIPWPQLGLMAMALASYIVPYVFIPLESLPLSVAIGTMFHNVQYFAFVWLFERQRAGLLDGQEAASLGRLQALALHGHWGTYAAYALCYSFLVVFLYFVLPFQAGLFLIYYIAFAHYVIDGYIWQRNNNRMLGPVLKRLAQAQ